MPDPLFSLILCTLGRTKPLQRLLTSLSKQTFKDFEVLVIDQNEAGTLDSLLSAYIGSFHIKHLYSKPGLSKARNVGLMQAQGQFLAFPDDDCWYPNTLLETVRELFDMHPELDLVTGVTRDESGALSNGKFLTQDATISRQNVWNIGNSNGLFVRASALSHDNAFNEALGVGAGTPFGSGEETDFILRLLAKGCKGQFFANLYTHHDQVDIIIDTKALNRAKSYATGFGQTLYLNHFSLPYALYRAIRSAIAAAFYLATGNMRMFYLKWAWARGTMAGYFSRVHVKATTQ